MKARERERYTREEEIRLVLQNYVAIYKYAFDMSETVASILRVKMYTSMR
jgi:hypothetical protein